MITLLLATTDVHAQITSTLKQGDVSTEVTLIQKILNKIGKKVTELGEETAYFGQMTAAAIKSLQCERGIACEGLQGYGIVGPATRALLNNLITTNIPTCPANPDLGEILADGVDSRIAGRTSSAGTIEMFNGFTVNTTNPNFVRNTNNWIAGVDFTGASPWNDMYSNGYVPGTLISPRHMVSANHFVPVVGTQMTFVAANNTVVKRTIVAQKQVGDTDIAVSLLDSDVPDTILYFPTFDPVDFKLVNIPDLTPVVVIDQDEHVFTHDSRRMNQGDIVPHDYSNTPSRVPFTESMVSNDSGSPAFVIIGDRAVIVSTQTLYDSGTSISTFANEINTVMDELGGGYRLTYFDLSCFNKKPKLASRAFAVSENTPGGGSVGFAGATDSVGQIITYAITGGANATSFTINSITGEIKTASGTVLDFETKRTYTFDISATDNDPRPLVSRASITVSVTDGIDKPVPIIVSPQSQGVVNTTSWRPVVDWGTATLCEYGYTGLVFANANCASAGSDISRPSATGTKTLYIRATNLAGEGIVSVTFNVSNKWNTEYGVGKKDWRGVAMSDDGTRIYATAIGGVYRSTDSGVTWSVINSASTSWGPIVASPNGVHLVTAANNGHIYTSSDGGASFVERLQSLNRVWVGFAMSADGQTINAISKNVDYIYRSTDGGATWDANTTMPSNEWLAIASSEDGQKVVVTSVYDYIRTSSNGGVTWVEQRSLDRKYLSNIAMSADGRVIVGTDSDSTDGFIYVSVNSGATWTKSKPAPTSSWVGLNISDNGGRIIAAASSDYIYTSTDRGASWKTETELDRNIWNNSGTTINTAAVSGDGSIVVVIDRGNYAHTGRGLFPGSDQPVETSTSTTPAPNPTPTPRPPTETPKKNSGGGGGSSAAKPTAAQIKTLKLTDVKAIKAFQTKYKLKVTGKFDKATLEKINALTKVIATTTPKFSAKALGLKLNYTGPDVIILQTFLESKKLLVIPKGVAKGQFGPATKAALIKWQVANKIVPADGTVNAATLKKLKTL